MPDWFSHDRTFFCFSSLRSLAPLRLCVVHDV
jgi:hypothetical protein